MKRIINNYIYSLMYQVSTFIIPIILIPFVISRLGPDKLGIDSFTISIISFYVVLANFGITTYGTRQIAQIRDNNEVLKNKTYSILLVKFLFTVISSLLFLPFILNHKYSLFFLFQLVYFFGSTIFDVNWYYAGLEKFKIIVLRNLFIKVIGALLIFLFINNQSDLGKYILINGVVVLIPNLYFFIKVIKDLGRPSIKPLLSKGIFTHIKIILPFFLLSISIQLYMNIDKVIMELYSKTYELGIYAQISKLLFAIVAPLTAIGTILMPFFSNSTMKQDTKTIENHLINSANFIGIISIGLFFGFQAISFDLINILFGSDYLMYENTIKLGGLLILVAGIYNFIIQQILLPNNKEGSYLKAIICATIIKIIVLLFLVPKYGINAVMLIYILSELIVLAICSISVRNIVSLNRIIRSVNWFKIICSGTIMYFSIILFDTPVAITAVLGMVIYVLSLMLMKEKLVITLLRKLKT